MNTFFCQQFLAKDRNKLNMPDIGQTSNGMLKIRKRSSVLKDPLSFSANKPVQVFQRVCEDSRLEIACPPGLNSPSTTDQKSRPFVLIPKNIFFTETVQLCRAFLSCCGIGPQLITFESFRPLTDARTRNFVGPSQDLINSADQSMSPIKRKLCE